MSNFIPLFLRHRSQQKSAKVFSHHHEEFIFLYSFIAHHFFLFALFRRQIRLACIISRMWNAKEARSLMMDEYILISFWAFLGLPSPLLKHFCRFSLSRSSVRLIFYCVQSMSAWKETHSCRPVDSGANTMDYVRRATWTHDHSDEMLRSDSRKCEWNVSPSWETVGDRRPCSTWEWTTWKRTWQKKYRLRFQHRWLCNMMM